MKNPAHDLAWIANIIRAEQEKESHCTIQITIKKGEIFKAEKSETFVPPRAGMLYQKGRN